MFPLPLLPRGPGFVQHGHHTPTQQRCSFTQAPPGQSQGLDQGGRSGLQEEAGTPGLGREGRNARGPKVQFCILSLFHNLGQVTTLQKREERKFKKINEDSFFLMKILEGGTKDLVRSGCKKKKRHKAHPLALELKRGLCGCLKKYARKVTVSTHSFQGTITTTG